MTADTHQPPGWIDDLLLMLKIPKTNEKVRFFKAQQKAEGGTAKWNPLNSTLTLGPQWTESTDYNTSSHVRNYKYAVAGVCATVLTFIQRRPDGTLIYGGWLNDFQNHDKTAEEFVNDNRAFIDVWGTDPDLMLTLLKEIQ